MKIEIASQPHPLVKHIAALTGYNSRNPKVHIHRNTGKDGVHHIKLPFAEDHDIKQAPKITKHLQQMGFRAKHEIRDHGRYKHVVYHVQHGHNEDFKSLHKYRHDLVGHHLNKAVEAHKQGKYSDVKNHAAEAHRLAGSL